MTITNTQYFSKETPIDLAPTPEESVVDAAISMTKRASKQTYYTIRFLVDHDLTDKAYQAYAYFRWVDDRLDQKHSDYSERLTFLGRQQALIDACYTGNAIPNLTLQEKILADLIRYDGDTRSGLHAYIQHLMKVMEFDAYRRGQVITQTELDDYSFHLAAGVTEALHYFIGHGDKAPQSESRYCAVTGAHITHMLRDTYEDIDAGYINIPCEYLNANNLHPCDIQNPAYQSWVRSRVHLARACFDRGKAYLYRVQNRRCRLAGFAYIARFESVLKTIEQEGYALRASYGERKTLRGALGIALSAWSMVAISGGRGRA